MPARPLRALAALVAALAAFASAAPAAHADARPSLRIEGPSRVAQGERFTVSVFLSNVGDTDGSIYLVDIATPPSAELVSAGFANTVSRGTSVAFDATGRAIHPILIRDGKPEIVDGKPGGELWVSFDQLNQGALVGAVNRLDADFRLAKDAAPGRPVRIRFRGGFLRSSPTGGGPVVTSWRTLRVTPTAPTLEEVAQSLESDPVYAAASADPGLPDSDETIVERAVADAGTPVAIAVLPASAGSPEGVLDRLVRLSGLGGTVVVLVGDRYRATSDRIPRAELERLLEEAGAGEPGAEPRDVLSAFVRAADRYVRGGDAGATTSQAPGGTTVAAGRDGDVEAPAAGGTSATPWIVAAAVVGGIALLLVVRRTARHLAGRRLARRRLAAAREAAEDELTRLGEAIADLDLDVEMPDVPQAAKDDYALALSAYEEARAKLPAAGDDESLRSAAETIALGREAIAAVTGRVAAKAPAAAPPPAGERAPEG
jgi:hypothetical protein